MAIDAAGETVKDLFPHLANRRPNAARTRQGWISNVVLNLLTEAIDRLIGFDLDHGDAISLVGRALFTRFWVIANSCERIWKRPKAPPLFLTTQIAPRHVNRRAKLGLTLYSVHFAHAGAMILALSKSILVRPNI